jgi:hypothetical protein
MIILLVVSVGRHGDHSGGVASKGKGDPAPRSADEIDRLQPETI